MGYLHGLKVSPHKSFVNYKEKICDLIVKKREGQIFGKRCAFLVKFETGLGVKGRSSYVYWRVVLSHLVKLSCMNLGNHSLLPAFDFLIHEMGG